MKSILMQHSGSETLLTAGISPAATLTPVQLSMFDRMTFADTLSVIGSPALAVGLTPSGSLDGLTIDPSGLAPAPASPSLDPARGLPSMTRATSGLIGLRSSASAGLQSFLESRLRDQLPGCGLTLYTLTWKAQATPSGREYFLLRASAPRNDAIGLGSWQTPTTRDGKGESGKGNRTKRGKPGKPHVANLCDQLVDLGRRDLVRSSEFRNHLMGYPTCWEDAAPMATRSSRKSPPNSSVQP